MRITTIRVRRLKSKSTGYGHYAIEAEALVDEDDDPEGVREELSRWVDNQIAQDQQMESMVDTLINLQTRTRDCENHLKSVEKRVKSGQAVIDAHEKLRTLAETAGLKIPGINDLGDDLPF